MRLSALSLLNFKNYSELDVSFGGSINCLLGNNGQGKTNVLDAIHLMSFCKSYFNPIDSQCIRFDQDYFMVQGEFAKDDERDLITCSVKKGRKKTFKKNKSDYEKLADHIGRYPVVMITPFDSNLVLGGSEMRRKFLDTVISQFDKLYLSSLISYNKVLDQRNALLKKTPYGEPIDLEMIDIYDQQLIALGKDIYTKRKDFIEQDLIKSFKKLYKLISNGLEIPALEYISNVDLNAYEPALKNALDKDRATGYTNVGTHKDDLFFGIDGYPLKKFASQGQQKSFLLALKLAYYKSLQKKMAVRPILLLDDIFDKLDKQRVEALMDIIADDKMGQTFITDTSLTRVPAILSERKIEHKVFQVSEGGLNET